MGEVIQINAKGPVTAYMSRPAEKAKAAVIVIHEVWGLVDQIKSVADRLADEGYIALAPDFIGDVLRAASVTGTKLATMQEALFDPERRSQIQPELRKLMTPIQNPEFGAETLAGLQAGFNYLYNMSEAKLKVAVMGFCFGGSYSFTLATEEPRLMAAIPFYGHADQEVDSLSKIKCPVLAFYGENDERLMASLDELKQKMEAAKVDFKAVVYPDCGHAFFNDTNRFTYNQAAAADAWDQTLNFLKENS